MSIASVNNQSLYRYYGTKRFGVCARHELLTNPQTYCLHRDIVLVADTAWNTNKQNTWLYSSMQYSECPSVYIKLWVGQQPSVHIKLCSSALCDLTKANWFETSVVMFISCVTVKLVLILLYAIFCCILPSTGIFSHYNASCFKWDKKMSCGSLLN